MWSVCALYSVKKIVYLWDGGWLFMDKIKWPLFDISCWILFWVNLDFWWMSQIEKNIKNYAKYDCDPHFDYTNL